MKLIYSPNGTSNNEIHLACCVHLTFLRRARGNAACQTLVEPANVYLAHCYAVSLFSGRWNILYDNLVEPAYVYWDLNSLQLNKSKVQYCKDTQIMLKHVKCICMHSYISWQNVYLNSSICFHICKNKVTVCYSHKLWISLFAFLTLTLKPAPTSPTQVAI